MSKECPNVIEVNGEQYEKVSAPRQGEALRLVIADNRGLTFVGYCDPEADGKTMTISDARCVIRWGTTKHLAEIVVSGPQANTKLGQRSTVHVPRKNIVLWYDLDKEQWQ